MVVLPLARGLRSAGTAAFALRFGESRRSSPGLLGEESGGGKTRPACESRARFATARSEAPRRLAGAMPSPGSPA